MASRGCRYNRKVAALCNLGTSTKSADVNTIGSKGIGFKSVFMVSDRPRVKSGDYSFQFDTVKHGRLGYVVPEWVEPEDDPLPCIITTTTTTTAAAAGTTGAGLSRASPLSSPVAASAAEPDPVPVAYTTLLWLPFRSPAQELWNACNGKFEQLEAETLLFLRRLKRIRFETGSRIPGGAANPSTVGEALDKATRAGVRSAREISVVEVEDSADIAAHNRLHPDHQISTTELRDEVFVACAALEHGLGGAGGSTSGTSGTGRASTPDGATPALVVDDSSTSAVVYRIHNRRVKIPDVFQSGSSASTAVVLGFRFDTPMQDQDPTQDPVQGGGQGGDELDTQRQPLQGDCESGGSGQGRDKAAMHRFSVFAHLPVGSVGLRFIVQASWALVSSRQQLRLDSPWNLWLREQVAITFAAAIAADSTLRCRLGTLLPRAGEVVDPFWTPQDL